MKNLIFALTTLLLILTGCQNEDEGQMVDLDTEEAKELVDESGVSLSNDIVTLVESKGVTELVHAFELLDEHNVAYARTNSKAWTNERLKNITQYFVKGPSGRVGASAPNSLEDIKGLYIWNAELNDFDFQTSDIFIVQFPTEGSESNNAEFKITNLEYQVVDGINWQITAPKLISSSLIVDNETIVTLEYDVSWSSSGTPETANVDLFVSPFLFEIDFVDSFEKSTSLLTSISIDNEVVIGIDVDVTYESADKSDPYLVEGFVQYRGLKLNGDINLMKIGESADPNDYMNLALYSGEDKLGDITFIEETDANGFKDYVPYVVYTDDSKQNLEEVLKPVLEEIERIFAEFE